MPRVRCSIMNMMIVKGSKTSGIREAILSKPINIKWEHSTKRQHEIKDIQHHHTGNCDRRSILLRPGIRPANERNCQISGPDGNDRDHKFNLSSGLYCSGGSYL